MPQIDFWCSTVSPYTYLAATRPAEIAARHGADLSYRPFDIGALLPRTGGQALKDRHPARQDYRLQELRRQAKKADMPLNLHPAHWPTNGAPSAYALIAAQAAGGGDVGALLAGIGAACWAQEQDIAEDGVIKACLEAAGFDPALADKGLMLGAETYSANTEAAILGGVFGAPFFIVDGSERFWGQDRLDDLDAYLGGNL